MKQCPWCLEALPRAEEPAECPYCGRELGTESEPRARDLRYQTVEARQRETYRQMLMVGTPIVAAVGLVVPFLHFGAVAVIPLLVACHLVVARVVLVRDAQRMLGPARRMLNRWLARFSFLWIGLPGYGAMTAPIAGLVVGAGTFALLTSIVHVSTLVSLERERNREKLAAWEKLLPAVLAVFSILAIAVAVALAVAFGWSVLAIVERLRQ
jgi:hypothetical protein